MNSSHRSWADDSSEVTRPMEVTRPVDVLALSGEQVAAANDDDVWPVELFLEDGWLEDGWDEPSPAMSFFIAGSAPTVVRLEQGSRSLTHAEGVVKRIDEDRLLLGTPGSSSPEVALGYRVPASLDLRVLIGRRVRLTLEEESSRGRTEQTLTIRTFDGRAWLVARCGGVKDVGHSLGAAEIRVSLSSNDGGPLVVAAPDLQHIVAVGGEARVRVGTSRYVVEVVSRDDAGGAAYFIADDRLWH